MNTDELEALANQLACPSGEQGIALATKMNEMNAFITAHSIEALNPTEAENIVEIGFGNGELSKPIIKSIGRDGHFIGIETSNVLAEEASAYFKLNNVNNVTIYNNDCNEITLKKNSQHGVLAVNVIYFIDNLESFLKNIYSWLKPGGRFVIGVRSEKSLKKMPFTHINFIIRTQEEIIKEIKKAGYINIETQYHDEGVNQFGDVEIPIDTLIIKSHRPL